MKEHLQNQFRDGFRQDYDDFVLELMRLTYSISPIEIDSDVWLHSIFFWPIDVTDTKFIISDSEKGHTRHVNYEDMEKAVDPAVFERLFVDTLYSGCKAFSENQTLDNFVFSYDEIHFEPEETPEYAS